MENLWTAWKRGFDAWEQATAKVLDRVMKHPAVLEPAGTLLTAWARAKRQGDEALARFWAQSGLPTRREQERILHVLNKLEGRLFDLEERLEERLADREERS